MPPRQLGQLEEERRNAELREEDEAWQEALERRAVVRDREAREWTLPKGKPNADV